MYDLLLTADFMVDDPDEMAKKLNAALGIHTHENWRQAFDTHAYIAHFLRVHKSLAVAPTRVEPQGHLDRPNAGDPHFRPHLKSLSEFQGPDRPMKTHSIVLASDDIDAVAERLFRRRVPFRMAQRTPEMPWDRLWVGLTPERPQYEPWVDGGLCIEVIPLKPLRLPVEVFEDPPPAPRGIQPGEMVRVVSRGYLVRDVDDTLRRLSTNLDLEPQGTVRTFASEGYRRAQFGFTIRHGASLDVIEPTRWNSETGLYLNNWGPGPYYTRIAVNGVEAKAADLEERGTPFSWLSGSEATGGPALRVDPDALDGALFEFVEWKEGT